MKGPGPGKTLAIAALVVGVLSLPTAGGFCLGAVVAVSLGVASLVRSRREPTADNGRELAIAGIVAAVASLLAAVPLGMLVVAWRQGNLLEDVRILSEWPEPKAGVSPALAPGWPMPAPPPPPPPRAAVDAPPPPPPPPPRAQGQPQRQPAAETARRKTLPPADSSLPGAGSTERKPSPSAARQRQGGEAPSGSSSPVAVSTAGKPASPVRVGGSIKEPRRLKMVSPVYPDLARQARIQGIVILECTIGVDGSVPEVKVLRSIPQLDSAAVEAVRQWVYEPTLLNGTPVPVIMTVTVNFTLN